MGEAGTAPGERTRTAPPVPAAPGSNVADDRGSAEGAAAWPSAVSAASSAAGAWSGGPAAALPGEAPGPAPAGAGAAGTHTAVSAPPGAAAARLAAGAGTRITTGGGGPGSSSPVSGAASAGPGSAGPSVPANPSIVTGRPAPSGTALPGIGAPAASTLASAAGPMTEFGWVAAASPALPLVGAMRLPCSAARNRPEKVSASGEPPSAPGPAGAGAAGKSAERVRWAIRPPLQELGERNSNLCARTNRCGLAGACRAAGQAT